MLNICSHTGSSTTSVGSFMFPWNVYSCAFVAMLWAAKRFTISMGFFCVSSNHLMLRICSHTWDSWMAYNRCGFFHGSSNCCMLNICRHTGSNLMVYQHCGFLHVSIRHLGAARGSNDCVESWSCKNLMFYCSPSVIEIPNKTLQTLNTGLTESVQLSNVFWQPLESF